jgi:hypothetical protein
MPHFKTTFATAFAACVLVAGCADGTVGLSTASVTPQQSAEAAAAQQRAANCAQLAAQIETLKADGSVGRLEQAASGSTSTVKVKREALAR